MSTACVEVADTLPRVSTAATLNVYVVSSVPVTLKDSAEVVETVPFASRLKYARSLAPDSHENASVVVATRQAEVESVPEQVEEVSEISGAAPSTNTDTEAGSERLPAASVA